MLLATLALSAGPWTLAIASAGGRRDDPQETGPVLDLSIDEPSQVPS